MRVSAIIVAAGEGRRFGGPKQFALLKGKSILDRTLEKFQSHEMVDEIVLVLPHLKNKDAYLRRYKKISAVVRGGNTARTPSSTVSVISSPSARGSSWSTTASGRWFPRD